MSDERTRLPGVHHTRLRTCCIYINIFMVSMAVGSIIVLLAFRTSAQPVTQLDCIWPSFVRNRNLLFLGCWELSAAFADPPDFTMGSASLNDTAILYKPSNATDESINWSDSGEITHENIRLWAKSNLYVYYAIAISRGMIQATELPVPHYGMALGFNSIRESYKTNDLSCTFSCPGTTDKYVALPHNEGGNVTVAPFNWRIGTEESSLYCGVVNGNCSDSYDCSPTASNPSYYGQSQVVANGGSFAVYIVDYS